MRIAYILISLVVITFSTGCQYGKTMKKGTNEDKLELARKLYDKGDFLRSQVLLDQLIGKFQRGGQAEEVYFMYAYTYYGTNDYVMAAYHFNNFVERYPMSKKYTEEAAFMVAKCAYQRSMPSELDQSNTKKAIEAVQLFINKYPQSVLVAEGNNLIDELRARLHEKVFNQALMYYKMESYNSSYTMFKNAVIDYPDLPEKERAEFYIAKSAFLYAQSSVKTAQEERYLNAIDHLDEYLATYPEGEHVREANQLKKKSNAALADLKNKNTTTNLQ